MADVSAPRTVGGARAETGAQALDPFLGGLRATDQAVDGRLTVVGHSYGSTVVGEAASAGDGVPVDDIIVAGSPGMRVDHAEDLQVDPNNVWAGHADGDHVSRWAGGSRWPHNFGPHREDFGGNRFEVDTTGHSDYWQEDTLSLRNQAAIVVGEYEQVELEHGELPQ